jgi:hypothetical protein
MLLQAAAHLPNGAPIYVTVQQSVAGTAEWVKILITGVIGATFGIASTLAMEYLKPQLVKSRTKKTVAEQLASELMDNLARVESAERLLKGADLKPLEDANGSLAPRVLWSLKTDRYELYFGAEKAIVYEIDENQSLSKFYETVKLLREGYDLKGNWHASELRQVLSGLRHHGDSYISFHKLAYNPVKNPLEDLLKYKDAPPID